MAIEYQFLEQADETLIATSELPVEDGIAVAISITAISIRPSVILTKLDLLMVKTLLQSCVRFTQIRMPIIMNVF